jgi:hypothetical protein
VNLDVVDYESTGPLAGTGGEAKPSLADFRFLVSHHSVKNKTGTVKANNGPKNLIFMSKLSPKYVKACGYRFAYHISVSWFAP